MRFLLFTLYAPMAAFGEIQPVDQHAAGFERVGMQITKKRVAFSAGHRGVIVPGLGLPRANRLGRLQRPVPALLEGFT